MTNICVIKKLYLYLLYQNKATMATTYEWDYETVDPESGDIIEHHHAEKLSDFGNTHKEDRLVLVCDTGNVVYGLQDRVWAYVVDGKLPEYFTDAIGEPVRKVPKKFHLELAKYISKQIKSI